MWKNFSRHLIQVLLKNRNKILMSEAQGSNESNHPG